MADPAEARTRASLGPRPEAAADAKISSSSRSFEDARFLPGAVLGERYRIAGLLGKGGMGEVYRADDLKLGQTVALKFLPLTLRGDDSRRQRLIGEVRIARQMCAGLGAAHEQGVLHRDLEPADVMIDGRGRARITNFGLAGMADGIEGGAS